MIGIRATKKGKIMQITIVGGGFGGVKAALELAKNKRNKITLITDKPDFQYYPALYSSATGHSHLESWVPLGTIFAGKRNIDVKLDTIVSINPEKKEVTGGSGKSYAYERCILALGVVTTYFGIKGMETYTYGIKSEAEIHRLKRHLYKDIAEKHHMDSRYIVIGAGPTGVELSAALGSYISRLCDHYGVSQKSAPRVELLEAAPRVLPRMSERTSAVVSGRLKKLGVHVRTGQKVESATAEHVVVDGKPMSSRTVIWTAGIMNHPFYKENNAHFAIGDHGKVRVDEHMLAAPGVHVIGDNADTPYSGLAQTALHDALFVAKNINREQAGKPPKRYRAIKPPAVVPVGENWAILEWHWLRVYGWIGALLRRAADFIGYNDMLPLGQALGVWHASMVMEDDYFEPELPSTTTKN
jgi:NADH:ubiquinone reductase (H+-translocating)